MEKIATDIYSFAELRKNGFTYVDKTARFLPLVDMSIGKQFFVARPRRFGKSLAVSILQCLFEGRRELFKGLAIEPKWDWSKTWPVLHLDMGSCHGATPEATEKAIRDMLSSEATRLGVPLRGDTLSGNFRFLIEDLAAASTDGQMVLLVDEYDKPLLNHLGEANVNAYRDLLKAFYSIVKTLEAKQRFTFITGVSKFSKVSIFSDLNNLNDFSMDILAATLFGYTHDEVKANFPEALETLARKLRKDAASTFGELVHWYDGYRFHGEAEPVFNPVSVGRCLSRTELKAYWFETGTPTFLLKLMADQPTELDRVEIPETMFSVYEPSSPALMPLLYQTGYLTIKGDRWDGGDHVYRLSFPNFEVSKAFSEGLAGQFTSLPDPDRASLLTQMVEALRKDDVNDMLDALSCFFANIPANITLRREKYYQSLFYAVFTLVGSRVQAECWTNRGRVDAVVETSCGIYIFEFKLNDTAAAALQQIKTKGYAEKYRRANKKVRLVGAAFDAEMRNLSDRAIEEL